MAEKNSRRILVAAAVIFIGILALFLRFYRIETAPPSLNWDEVSHGYNAYSLLKTGRDEWGTLWPTIFPAYGDYKLPVYIYLTAVSEKIFGLNELGIRFPSAFAGVLTVIFVFLLGKTIFRPVFPQNTALFIGLAASFFLAVSPWHFFLSRPAFEASVALLLVVAGVYFFLMAMSNSWFLPASVFFLGLSVYTYNSARVFTPLILIILFFLYRKEIEEKIRKNLLAKITMMAPSLFFFLLLFFSFFLPGGLSRVQQMTVIDQGKINQINAARSSSRFPEPWRKIIHNRVTYFALAFTQNFFSNLSPEYLFFRGGSNFQYNLVNHGVIYWLDLPLLVIGLFWGIKNLSKREAKLIFAWWALALIPASVTRDNPHVLRTILVLPMPQILTAVGAALVWDKFKKFRWIIAGGYFIVLSLFLSNFLKSYFGEYRKNYAWVWQDGYKQVADFVAGAYRDYDQIIISKRYGEPHEFILFYLRWDPAKYQNDPSLIRYQKSGWFWVDRFDKFVFINDWEIKDKLKLDSPAAASKGRVLLITSPGNYPSGWSKIETIYFLDGQKAFEILEHWGR